MGGVQVDVCNIVSVSLYSFSTHTYVSAGGLAFPGTTQIITTNLLFARVWRLPLGDFSFVCFDMNIMKRITYSNRFNV